MKKLIVLVLIVAAGYLGYAKYGSTLFKSGAFDKGKATVLLFTMDGCGQPCSDVAADLRSRNVEFEEVNVSTDKGRDRIQQFGVMQVPLTVIGDKKIIGSDLPAIESALAEAKGMDALSPAAQQVMKNHFDTQGKPRVIMYGTETCTYCKQLRAYMETRHIPYFFVDVSYGYGRSDFETLRGRGYPLTFVGYRRIDGYSTSALDQAVKDLL